MLISLVTLLAFKAAAAEKVHPAASTILWFFTSTGEKIPSAKSSLITSRHELFRLYYHGLSGYNHSSQVATLPRIEHELRTKKLACYPASSEADRRREFSYLTPQYVHPSPRLVLSKELATSLFKDKKSVSLADILENKKLKGVISKSRSFGPSIDKLLRTNPKNLDIIPMEVFSNSALQMIKNRRAAYTIEYQFILKALTSHHSMFAEITSLPINDIDPVMTQYLACSKTPQGLEVVKKADSIIRENIRKPSYWVGVLESVPEEDRKSFQKEIDRFIEDRSKKFVIIQ